MRTSPTPSTPSSVSTRTKVRLRHAVPITAILTSTIFIRPPPTDIPAFMHGEEVGVPCLGQRLGLPELLNPLRGSDFDESAQTPSDDLIRLFHYSTTGIASPA